MSMSDPRNFRIPVLGWPANAGSYHDTPVDQADPRGAEPLVDLAGCGIAGENFYARTDGQNAPYNRPIDGAITGNFARKRVAEMLENVNKRLAAHGVELFVFDAYRPVACQAGLWDFFNAHALDVKPEASEAERRDYVLNFVSDPSRFSEKDSTSWPVHACGGSVDLTLRRLDTKELVDMGTGFDEMSSLVFSDAFERKLNAHQVANDDPRLLNRRLLHWAMTEEGFVNYPLEFWHFNYGDQMYAFHKRLLGHFDAPRMAWYGYAQPPEAL